MRIRIEPSHIGGIITTPPSKSMAHRAVLCAALGDGISTVTNLAFSRDVLATLSAVRDLGCRVDRAEGGVRLTPAKGFATIHHPVDCGESGSTLRFLIPLFALTGQKVLFTGHGRLMQRPQQVYADLLPAHGTRFTQDESGITVFGAPRAGNFALPGNVSSQFVSGLLFALPLLETSSTITVAPPLESRSYIELTRSMQAQYGVHSEWKAETTLFIPGGQRYHAADTVIEGDFSQAAFFSVLGALCGDITITGLPGKTRQGDAAIFDILNRAGASMQFDVGAVRLAAHSLSAVTTDLSDCPDLGPLLMVLGACSAGTTTIVNAARLRIKESDRIDAMEQELRKFGCSISSTQDTVTIIGGGLHAPNAVLSAHNDHRIAMSLAVLALANGFSAELDGAESVQKSWPDFWEVLRRTGAVFEEEKDA